MKGFALVLLFVAAAQARSTGVDTNRALAAAGENPWLVHLRLAVSTSGFLKSCAGSLIDGRWVLTAASCLSDATFIWVRYGAIDVIEPQLLTESGAGGGNNFRLHPKYDPSTGANDIAVVSINRYVLLPPNRNIATVPLATEDAELPASGKVCTYGADKNGAPGDFLSCVDASLSGQEDGSIAADAETTDFDLGSPLVQDGVQYGILTKAGDSSSFLNPAAYIDWIQEETGVNFSAPEDDGEADGEDDGEADGEADGEDDGEADGEDEESDGGDEGRKVHFVN